MENFPKTPRGRPRKIPESQFGEIERKVRQMPERARQELPFDAATERTRANRFYADKARAALQELSKELRIPHDPVLQARTRVGMDWILGRTTVLSELGRMMVEDPSQEDVARFHDAVVHVAERHGKLSATDAVAYVRRMRMGATGWRERREALHHALNAAINHHRRRFPESSWADVLKALELTEGQVRKQVR